MQGFLYKFDLASFARRRELVTVLWGHVNYLFIGVSIWNSKVSIWNVPKKKKKSEFGRLNIIPIRANQFCGYKWLKFLFLFFHI